jgi:hypothetical protein
MMVTVPIRQWLDLGKDTFKETRYRGCHFGMSSSISRDIGDTLNDMVILLVEINRELEHVPPNAVYGLSVVCTWTAVVYYGFVPIFFSAQFPLTIHGENSLIEIMSYFEPEMTDDNAGK